MLDAQLDGVHSWLESQPQRFKSRNAPRSPGGTSLPLQDEHWDPEGGLAFRGLRTLLASDTHPPASLLPQVLPTPDRGQNHPGKGVPWLPVWEPHGLPAWECGMWAVDPGPPPARMLEFPGCCCVFTLQNLLPGLWNVGGDSSVLSSDWKFTAYHFR